MPRVLNPLPQLIPQRVAKTKSIVDAMCWERSEPLDVAGGPVSAEMVSPAAARRLKLTRVRPGDTFGPARGGWKQRWFRVDVPAARRGESGRRHLQWDCQGETTAYIGLVPWAGLDLAHASCPLLDGRHTVWLDCSTWQTGIWIGRPGSDVIGAHGLRFEGCRMRVRHDLAWETRWDLDACIQLVAILFKRDGIRMGSVFGHQPSLDACSPLLRLVLRGLDDACDAFVAGGLPALRPALRRLARRLPAEAWQPAAGLVGHAHIDLVWLWPEVATERKGVHSFATQLRLLERYPEMVFAQSQPALYRAVEKRAPQLMKQIRARIREGRWEPMGALEVEPDTNLPSGESLVRSLQIGQRKLADLAGRPSPVCWIPDVFGYSNCLPQILRLGGVGYFYTTKMTWSAITRFPYNSFVWRGADGSDVVAHLCSTGYNGTVELENLDTALREHRQADVHPEMLLPTGIGDGGGGVSEAMCERARRLASLAGAPRTRWTTTEAFFRRLERARSRLPVYQGELYLEYHRGTYTTQSELKRLHRAAEVALQAHEAVRVVKGGGPLPDESWQRVLFAQFHDALPGSSIRLVYEQLNPELASIGEREHAAARAELERVPGSARAKSASKWIAFNPLPQRRTCVVALPSSIRLAGAQRLVALTLDPLEAVEIGPFSGVSDPREGLAPRGLAPLRLRSGHARRGALQLLPVREATPRRLDNGVVRAEFDRRGQLAALEIEGTPIELEAPAGFVLYHDQPANFDAWDIDHYSFKAGVPVARRMSLTVVESGPVRARLRGASSIGERTRIEIDYILDAGCRYLRIEARIDWREAHRLLKFHVPTAYRGRWARYGCPFGSIQRPQAPGVADDEAMWEVPGSRWAAVVRDDGEGAALCTEAKYGFSCREGDLGLSLLRSSKEPDHAADMGEHHIRFALGRHEPVWRDGVACTAAAADALFAPVLVCRGLPFPSPFRLDALGGLVPSWTLPAGATGGFILRLHETNGSSGRARLSLGRPTRAVDVVDLRERRVARARPLGGGDFEIPYAPYQVISVRVR